MSASARRTVVVTMAGMAVAFLLVWSASTGPAGLAEGVPSRPMVGDATSAPEEQVEQEPSDEDQRRGDKNVETLGTGLQWLQDMVGVAVFLAALWVVTAAVRALLNVIGGRLPEKQLVVDLDPLPDLEVGRDAVARDRERHLDALAHSDVRNGIVACWVLLEEAAAEAGVVRRPAETATEFVVRFLHALDVDPRPVAQLEDLYHEARFSTHRLGADARSRAEAALEAIHEDLAHAGAAT